MRKLLLPLLLGLLFFSCESPLVNLSELPQNTGATYSSPKDIHAPTGVTASNGRSKKIEMTWKAESRAVKYNIWIKRNPFETQGLCIATTDKNHFDYVAEPGVSGWFYVTAVSNLGSESVASEMVQGSTLGKPTITDIDENTETGETTVSWFMENELLVKDLVYTISCREGSTEKSTLVFKAADLEETKCTFLDLPHGKYKFTVNASTIYEQNGETSVESSIETMPPQRPLPVEELEVSQGLFAKDIQISFRLPDVVNIVDGKGLSGNQSYTTCPLYFRLERKGPGDSGWQEISTLFHDGSTSKTKAELTNAFCDSYAPGNLLTYTDKCSLDDTNKLLEGQIYQYRVKSYVLFPNKEITENVITNAKSIPEGEGWIPNAPVISARKGDPLLSETGTIDAEIIHLDVNWNSLGKSEDWDYIIKQEQIKEFEDGDQKTDPETAVYTSFDVLSAGIEKNISFVGEDGNSLSDADIKKQRGYYKWTLYIVNKGVTSTDNVDDILLQVETQELLVINDPDITYPEITVEDGYKDKVIVYIKKNENLAASNYTLYRQEVGENGGKLGERAEVESLTWTDAVYPETNEAGFTYTDNNVESGKSYYYAVVQKTDAGVKTEKELSTPAITLGTPSVRFDEMNPKQKSVTVSWRMVQKASEYEVLLNNEDKTEHAKWIVYKETDETGTSWKVHPAEGNRPEMNGTVVVENNVILKFTVEKPFGWNKAKKSGKTLELSVSAVNIENDVEKDRTSASTNVRTLGPANIKVDTGIKQEKSISLSWDAVKGAKKYMIRRTRQELDGKDTGEVEEFVVNAIKPEGNKEAYEDLYSASYDKLVWGYPFTYEVFPLDEEESPAVTDILKSDKIYAIGSTKGFGLDVKAEKSESNSEIKITWKAPNYDGNVETATHIYVKEHEGNNWIDRTPSWNTKPNLNGEFTYNFKPSWEDRDKAYDFAVSYGLAPTQAYLNAISQKADNEVEEPNKGYIFAISLKATNIADMEDANKAGFGEKYEWVLWDYSKRAEGPDEDKYVLTLQNNDYGADPVKLGDISVSSDGVTSIEKAVTSATDNIRVSFADDKMSVLVYPNNKTYLEAGKETTVIYNGLLKTLRDYRHFVNIDATRGELHLASGNEYKILQDNTVATTKKVYGYRNITDAEFARAALLVLTYGFYKNAGGKDDYTNVTGSCYVKQAGTHDDGNGGKFANSSGTLGGIKNAGKYYHTMETESNYAPKMLSNGGISTNIVSISLSSTEFWRNGLNEGFLRITGEASLSVNPVVEGMNFYKGKVTITCDDSQKSKITVTRDGIQKTLCEIAADMKYWFPIQIKNNKTWYINNPDYYWW